MLSPFHRRPFVIVNNTSTDMKTFILIQLIITFVAQSHQAFAQIRTLAEVQSNAAIRVEKGLSNAESSGRLHSSSATGEQAVTHVLNQKQLAILDMMHNPTTRSNFFAQPHSALELQEITNALCYFVTNGSAQNEYFVHSRGMNEADYASNLLNAMRQAPPPKPWLESPRKETIFDHCARVLRSSIGTNKVEEFAGTLKSKTDRATLMRATTIASTNLDLLANLLSSPELHSFIGLGYQATISNEAGVFTFSFWPAEGLLPVVVRSLEKRTADQQCILLHASFWRNGNLKDMAINSLGKGVPVTQVQILFGESGVPSSYWIRPRNEHPPRGD
jgi:hypothetical protein